MPIPFRFAAEYPPAPPGGAAAPTLLVMNRIGLSICR